MCSFRCLLMQAHRQKKMLLESWMPLRRRSLRSRASMQERRHSMTYRPLYWRS
jgi:hypothetical protein